MIPSTQFSVFIVTSESTGVIMGVYQTYKQAYERILSVAKGSRLQEYHFGFMFERYGTVHRYSIRECLFTYDPNEPLVKDYICRLEASRKGEFEKSTVINM